MKAEYRITGSSPGSSFKARFFVGKEFPAAWHFHPQYELTYMLSSSGIRYVGDNIDNFEYGDMVMVGANLPHCWKTIGKQVDKVKCVIIQWDEGLLGDWLNKSEILHIRNLLQLSQRGIKFHKDEALKLEQKLLDIIKQEPFERLLSFLSVLQQLATTEQFELLAGPGYTNVLTTEESERINCLHDFVKKNIHRQITLDEVANKVSMGKEAFCRFFKKTFNKSFFEFINEYKVNLASKMLIDTDFSVSEIAYKIGYNNLSFFYRQFDKFKSTSPLKYRKKYRHIPK